MVTPLAPQIFAINAAKILRFLTQLFRTSALTGARAADSLLSWRHGGRALVHSGAA